MFRDGEDAMATATLPAPDELEPAQRVRHPRRRWFALVLAVLLVAGGLAIRAWAAGDRADIRSGTTVVDADGLAAR